MTPQRILIVAAEPALMQMLRAALEPLPAEVLEARHGDEALPLARMQAPQLVLIETILQGMSGFEVAEALTRDAATAAIPFVFVGALGAPQETVRGLGMGAEDYVVAPIDAEELRARLRRILQRRPPAAAQPVLASGTLDVISLPSLLQVLEGERTSARIRLQRGAEEGEILLAGGQIVDAVQRTRRGKPALYQLLSWGEGRFQMLPSPAAARAGPSMDDPTQALLMEGLRRLDEGRRLRQGLRDGGGPLGLQTRLLDTLLREAPAGAAGVVRLLDGSRTLDQVVTESPVEEWTTLRIIDYLFQVSALEPAALGRGRRQSPRIPLEVPEDNPALRAKLTAPTYNLSAGGVFLQSTTPRAVADRVRLQFRLPGRERPVQVIGEVVWQNTDPSKAGGVGMGLRFLDLALEDREIVERYLVGAIVRQIGDSA